MEVKESRAKVEHSHFRGLWGRYVLRLEQRRDGESTSATGPGGERLSVFATSARSCRYVFTYLSQRRSVEIFTLFCPLTRYQSHAEGIPSRPVVVAISPRSS